jgi:hypothetical protein
MSEKKALKARGSILLEILAVLLAVGLIFTLIYPKNLWDKEAENVDVCHENMWHIYFAEITYLDSKLVYNDTLENVIGYILSDSTEGRLRRYTSIDSILGMDIITSFRDVSDTVVVTVDSVFGEGPDSVIVLQKNIVIASLVDSMLSFANAEDLDTTEAFILDSLRAWPEYSERIDSIALATLNQIYNCPTTGKPYIIEAFNDTTPKLVNIFCPLDSTDKAAVKKDFKLNFLGGLRVDNHGGIESGEKTW